MPFALEQIRQALARHQPQQLEPLPHQAEAAVALVLAGHPELSLCVIRRAEHPEDRWSGHLALPGGRADPGDPHPRAVAERETLEEVGLVLDQRHWLGDLSHVLVRVGGGDRRMVLYPFVYYLGADLPAFTPSDEVAEAFWVPLSHLWDPANAGHVEWAPTSEPGPGAANRPSQRDRLVYPAIRFRGHAIWGLTFRILTLFSDVLDAPLPHLEEIPGLGR